MAAQRPCERKRGEFIMQENQLCAVTAENRAMVGFVGCDNEYLVIPPEVTLDGKCCPLSVISGKAFLRCAV